MSSVPNQWALDGGLRNWSLRSVMLYGAISGAKIATSTRKTRNTRPIIASLLRL